MPRSSRPKSPEIVLVEKKGGEIKSSTVVNVQFMSPTKRCKSPEPVYKKSSFATNTEMDFASKLFDKYDKNNNGVLDLEEITPLCIDLNLKPWLVIRHAKICDNVGQITKTAFLNYWFDAHKARAKDSKGFVNDQSVTTVPKKRTALKAVTSDQVMSSRVQSSVMAMNTGVLQRLDEKLQKALVKDNREEARLSLKMMSQLIDLVKGSREVKKPEKSQKLVNAMMGRMSFEA